MAFNSYNNTDSNSKKGYEPIVYSDYNVSNREGIDPSFLSYQFYNGMLKISISPLKPGVKAGDTTDIWDHDNAGCIYLPHVKARLLVQEINYILAHPDEVYNGGVTAGNALISFSTGKELGATSPCIIIRRINPQTGECDSTYAYQFKTNYYYGIRNFNPDTPSEYTQNMYDDTEIKMFLDLLTEYYIKANGAAAYMFMKAGKYDTSRNNTKIGLIMEKLGIESKSDYSKKSSGGGSYFNNHGNSGSSSQSSSSMRSNTMEALERELDA